MNTFRWFFVAAIFVGAAAQAQENTKPLDIDCRTLARPTQSEVSRALDIANFTAAYAARERVMQIARSKCLRGANEVRISAEQKTTTAKKIALVQR